MNSLSMRNDDLCIYHCEPNPSHHIHPILYYFAKGQKDGLKIPLVFDPQVVKQLEEASPYSMIPGFRELLATDCGLVIGAVDRGFWIIPWSDIDAYRARVAAEAKPVEAATSSNR